jgi:hypothetical protein
MSVKITIPETADDATEMAERLRHIADLLEQDFTSGYHPAWSLDDAPE